jgi:hypothetical protein
MDRLFFPTSRSQVSKRAPIGLSVGVEPGAVGGQARLFEQFHHSLTLLFDQVLRLLKHRDPSILPIGFGLQHAIEEGVRLVCNGQAPCLSAILRNTLARKAGASPGDRGACGSRRWAVSSSTMRFGQAKPTQARPGRLGKPLEEILRPPSDARAAGTCVSHHSVAGEFHAAPGRVHRPAGARRTAAACARRRSANRKHALRVARFLSIEASQ